MQIGSLVELYKYNTSPEILKANAFDRARGVIFPVKGVIYTVRSIERRPIAIGIRLEEIVNPKFQYGDGFMECLWNIEQFREVQPPMDLTEFIEECQCVPVENNKI